VLNKTIFWVCRSRRSESDDRDDSFYSRGGSLRSNPPNDPDITIYDKILAPAASSRLRFNSTDRFTACIGPDAGREKICRPSEIPRYRHCRLVVRFSLRCSAATGGTVVASLVSSVVENSISLSRRWFRLERIDQQWLDDD
jgi:hypothetical protein